MQLEEELCDDFPDIDPYPEQQIKELFQKLHQISDLNQIGRELSGTNILEIIKNCIIDRRQSHILQQIESFYFEILNEQFNHLNNTLKDIYGVWTQMKSFGDKLKQILFQLDSHQIENIIALKFMEAIQLRSHVSKVLVDSIIDKIINWKDSRINNQSSLTLEANYFEMVKDANLVDIFTQKYVAQCTQFYQSINNNLQAKNTLEKLTIFRNIHVIETEFTLYAQLTKQIEEIIQREIFIPNQDLLKDLHEFYDIPYLEAIKLAYQYQFYLNSSEATCKFKEGIFNYVYDQTIKCLENDILGLLFLHEKFKRIQNEAFNSQQTFIESVDHAIEFAFSKNIEQASMQLNRVFSEQIGNPKAINFTLLQYLDCRDYFQDIYLKDMLRRIISTQEYDLELAQLCNISSQVEFIWVQQCENLIKEAKDSAKLIIPKFNTHQVYRKNNEIQIHLSIFNVNDWPYKNLSNYQFISQFSKIQANIMTHYQESNQNCELSWQYNKSSCMMAAHINKTKFTLEAPLLQCTILLLFNDKPMIQIKELISILTHSIAFKDLEKIIFQLIRCNLLIKSGDSDEISTSDTLKLNLQYSSKQHSLKLQEIEAVPIFQKVKEDRLYIVDSIILKYMKSVRRCSQQALISHVIQYISIFQHKFKYLSKDGIVAQQVFSLQRKQFLLINELTEEIEYVP